MLRTIGLGLTLLTLGIGFLGIVYQRERRALDDFVARTAVVYDWDAKAARPRWHRRTRGVPASTPIAIAAAGRLRPCPSVQPDRPGRLGDGLYHAAMSFTEVTQPHPQVAVVTLNRPERMNAMAFEVMIPFRDALRDIGDRQRGPGRRDHRRRARLLLGCRPREPRHHPEPRRAHAADHRPALHGDARRRHLHHSPPAPAGHCRRQWGGHRGGLLPGPGGRPPHRRPRTPTSERPASTTASRRPSSGSASCCRAASDTRGRPRSC